VLASGHRRSAEGGTYGAGIETEVEREEEMLATGLVDEDNEVVVVAATNSAELEIIVVLSDGRVGSSVISNDLRPGTEVGMGPLDDIGYSGDDGARGCQGQEE